MKFILFFLYFYYSVNQIDGERILILTPVSSKSHKIALIPIAEGLAEKGHLVTVVSAHKSDKDVDNLREIVIGNAEDKVPTDWFSMSTLGESELFRRVIETHKKLNLFGYDFLMANREFRNILKDRAVDLVIVDAILNDFTLPIIDTMKVPFIYHSSASILSITMVAMGVPMDYASIPAGMPGIDDNMSFFQRLLNMMSSEIYLAVRKNSILAAVDERVSQDFPDARPISVIEREAALCIVNHHWTTAWPRPFPPNVIPIGALHVRSGNPLPEDLQVFADDAADGFIIFSLGSIIPMTSMPRQAIELFLRVFSKIPQRVIWKWDGLDWPNASSNVLFLKWLPQQDLLAHPNARLIISHGGLLGIQESVYHGVPLLGLPLFNDQPNNLAKIQREGMGLVLEWSAINEDILLHSIRTLIDEPTYQANAKRQSNIMRHEMIPGKDAAVYWVEHVLRRGADHLQPAAKMMPFYQQHLLDIWLFLAVIVLVVCYATCSLITCVCKCSRKPSKVKTH